MQPALVEFAGLHDDGEMLALILEQRKVLQGVAIDDQQIGEGARSQRSDLALQPQDLRGDDRCRADDLDGRYHFAPQRELAALVPVQLAQQVAAVGHRHAVALADLQRFEPAF